MKSTIDILKDARELIAKDKGWTQHNFAKSKEGYIADWNSRGASCFCTMGAVYRAAGTSEYIRPVTDALYYLETVVKAGMTILIVLKNK